MTLQKNEILKTSFLWCSSHFEIEFAYKNENFAEAFFLYFILLLLPGERPSSMMGEKILESKSNKKLFLIFFI